MPGNLVVERRCRNHVGITVTIEVGRYDAAGPMRSRCDHLLATKRPTPEIFIPSNLVIGRRCRDYICVSVSIEVGRKYTRGTPRSGSDHLLRAEATSLRRNRPHQNRESNHETRLLHPWMVATDG